MGALRCALRIGFFSILTVLVVPLALLLRVVGAGSRGRRGRLAIRWTAALQRRWSRIGLAVCGISLTASGPESTDGAHGPRLIVANHLSYMDILVLSALHGGRFVAKGEIATWPILGWVASSGGTIFLDQASRRALVEVGEEIRRTFEAGVSVVLFPEGRATGGAEVGNFHAALLQPAVEQRLPCVPVTLSYGTPGSRWAPAWTACWWGGMPFWSHLVRLLSLPRIEARAAWADEPLVGEDRRSLARALHAEVSARFEPLAQDPAPPEAEAIQAVAAEAGPRPGRPS
jgi:1-acyl-sn-glycerol-3-phosphate acyltransferase